MKQCETCLNYEAEQLGRCGPLEADAAPDEKEYCMAYPHDDGEGIPDRYLTDAVKCPARIEKE